MNGGGVYIPEKTLPDEAPFPVVHPKVISKNVCITF